MKRKYITVRDLNNQTGATQTWEYFDIIDDFINPKPEVAPISIASSTHGFRMRQSTPPIEQIMESADENNSAAINTSCDIRCNIRKRRQNDEPKWVKVLCKQREDHHKENIKIKKRFLTLFENYLQKDNAQ